MKVSKSKQKFIKKLLIFVRIKRKKCSGISSYMQSLGYQYSLFF